MPASLNRQVDDVRIKDIFELAPPSHLLREFKPSDKVEQLVFDTRREIHKVLHGADDRLVVVVGPCSIHDKKAAHEYAHKLKALRDELAKDLVVVMRVYFEKPRTTVGWKGLINDPFLDGSFKINEGLRLARELLLEINEIGVPAATEFLDTLTPQYYADLISWGAIGARTTESQVHRQLASGMSCPMGFKNGTDGNIKIAVDAIKAAAAPHFFLSVTKGGHSAIISTNGNEDCHVILRGGKGPNYDAASVQSCAAELAKSGVHQKIMIDFSHANSSKQHEKQIEVSADVGGQMAAGDDRIFGVMIESHINGGRQDLAPGKTLDYGVSVTDACIDWASTETVLRQLANDVQKRRIALQE
ncbi:MAG: 3-deoxy-7-phosphoheptulonate synthase [Betaproteobacteria bacterium]|nr:MAG: 3-deoxy-7-phosphoheptulonate synthase [Betaproteobacteria bacterium]TAG48265.1 MAG: 3-deoxy-7-phosphoheptulonate synthase [Betaproteobacteria bacterium]